jgi:hypothetical protein
MRIGASMHARTVRRALIVIAAYLISFVGGFPLMAMGAYALLFNEPFGVAKLTPLIWLYAWIAHAKMSIAWVRNSAVPRRLPLWGTVAGVLSLVSPMLLVVNDPPVSAHRLEAALVSTAVVAAFLLPCILLAIYLVRFHLQTAGVATLPDAHLPDNLKI